MDHIKAFLALPPEALPAADYVGTPGILTPWRALRAAADASSDLRELLDGAATIRLRADRDGWRDGVLVTV